MDKLIKGEISLEERISIIKSVAENSRYAEISASETFKDCIRGINHPTLYGAGCYSMCKDGKQN